MNDSLLQIIDSPILFTTRDVVASFGALAHTSGTTDEILDRFMVSSITQCKDESRIPHHEMLVVSLIDTKPDANDELYLTVLERTCSDTRSSGPPTPNLHTSIASRFSRSRERLGYRALNDTDSDSTSQLSLLDTSVLASASSVHLSTQSILPSYLATDTIRGGRAIESYAQSIHNIRQLEPTKLSFFDLIVLADTLHNHEPNYSSLGSNCFWFAKTICNVVETVYYPCKIVTGVSEGSPAGVNRTDYLPDLSGRVKGLLVSWSDNDLSAFVTKFKKNLAETSDDVSFLHHEC
jgi:hypothetical protein